ncbi:hypothetical protein CEXT_549171 [Caerostris extrusa]|uniref:Uncharacterized protein n=1 Tax=Caerostris extrusa TaxID=172846 RepID=A0AAV4Y2J6_CAEEX|nr:hypothetical protein CEXT_549171 [Caerostris extrusa]
MLKHGKVNFTEELTTNQTARYCRQELRNIFLQKRQELPQHLPTEEFRNPITDSSEISKPLPSVKLVLPVCGVDCGVLDLERGLII